MRLQMKVVLFFVLAIFLNSCTPNDSTKNKESEDYLKRCKDDSILKLRKRDSIRLVDFPSMKKMEDFKRTEFVPTLESNMSRDKNSIYCVTLLYALKDLKDYLKKSITLRNSSMEFDVLDKSDSYSNALESDDYEVDIKMSSDTIEVKVHFYKSLPFYNQLTNFSKKNNFKFDGKNVSSFGVQGFDIIGSEILKIVYYKDDDNFIIKLLSLTKNNDILLFKTNKNFATMKDYVIDLNNKMEIGKKEMKNDETAWRYKITDEDLVYIPMIKFNIENNYNNIIRGANSTSRNFKLVKVCQKNAFILNEMGAGVLSDVDLVGVASAEPSVNTPKPKHMKFDKPFFIMLKKSDSEYPYFAIRLLNNELMILE